MVASLVQGRRETGGSRVTEHAELTEREQKMLDVARAYGWHTLSTASEIETSKSLARKGYGYHQGAFAGHDGTFKPNGRQS